jgi:hypothetical protein
MKVAVIERPAAAGRKTAERIQAVRTGNQRRDLERAKAAADQQVAEIERTFSIRWEW